MTELVNLAKELGLARLDPYLELKVSMEIVHAEFSGIPINWDEIKLRHGVAQLHAEYLAQLERGRSILLAKVGGQASNSRLWHQSGMNATRCRTRDCAKPHYATAEEVVEAIFAEAVAGNEQQALGLCRIAQEAVNA
ncbi:MAG: hypothetical protein ACTH4Y_03755 [Microbacterium gubbeenense]|uniref:hypothetical protein n=1 Tax=Microbacterium gubbeenense TaxID=159896 RepID=UPI003F9D0E2E